MSKPLSWHLDDYPKLKIEHPWLKNAIEKLENEVKLLEAARKAAAELSEERRALVLELEDARDRLIAKVERMEEAWDALPRSEAVDQLIASRDEVKRLEVALVVRDVKNDRLRADGIEAAVVIVERQLWIQPNNREILIAKIRATAHDKPEADANNADFRDGGYGKEPI